MARRAQGDAFIWSGAARALRCVDGQDCDDLSARGGLAARGDLDLSTSGKAEQEVLRGPEGNLLCVLDHD